MASDAANTGYDLLVIGGGINGAGIARDAAGRGLRVALCERGDFGGETSMASSKLIHGGLRYLEQGEFRLVRESLAEREVLLRIAPHLVRPLRFVLPHVPELRPAWMIRLGLWLYDHLARDVSLPRSRLQNLRKAPFDRDLQPRFRAGFAYADCRVDDARLVIASLVAAHESGASLFPRMACTGIEEEGGGWQVTLESPDGAREAIWARGIANAAGPWVAEVLRKLAHIPGSGRVRLVRGSHIVVPRCLGGEHAYLLQNDDRRIVFLLPFESDFTLIGTTESTLASPSRGGSATVDEVAYLCRAANRYLAHPIAHRDVVWSFSGVRALFDDGHASPTGVTRDYHLQLDRAGNGAPILSVFGGKVTTYRRLAEHAVEKLFPEEAGRSSRWTADVLLPGGWAKTENAALVVDGLRKRYPRLPKAVIEGVFGRHGLMAAALLGDARLPEDLGVDFGAGLTEREIDYFMQHEWAMTAEDVLWRRSKCGLHMSGTQREEVARWIGRRHPAPV